MNHNPLPTLKFCFSTLSCSTFTSQKLLEGRFNEEGTMRGYPVALVICTKYSSNYRKTLGNGEETHKGVRIIKVVKELVQFILILTEKYKCGLKKKKINTIKFINIQKHYQGKYRNYKCDKNPLLSLVVFWSLGFNPIPWHLP